MSRANHQARAFSNLNDAFHKTATLGEAQEHQGLPEIIPGLVSTIIPTYNRAEMLIQAVRSVLDQDYRPIEIIVVDDGSTDDTLAVARNLAAQYSNEVIVFQQRNAGPGMARQKGLEAARGEFIQFLDSDDLLIKNKFSLQVDRLRHAPDCQICYGISHDHMIHESQSPRAEPTKGTGEFHPTLFPRLLIERWWSTNTPLYRHSVLRAIGPWQSLINEEDWEYDARLAGLNVKLAWVPQSVSIKRWFAIDQHLSTDGSRDPIKLRHRALARCSIYRSALQAGISPESEEMNHFARSAFLIARQCCAANLKEEARWLLDLARQAGSLDKRLLRDIRVFAILVSLIGARRAFGLSERLYKIRRRR
ncbi:MAG: glycosyltransferase family 2 protein [Cyanobium sp.]|jgi:hypothetical protein|nr:glycosyltransferase family A protein [Synechococcaceae cyanobacterium]